HYSLYRSVLCIRFFSLHTLLPPPTSTLFPYTTLFRSPHPGDSGEGRGRPPRPGPAHQRPRRRGRRTPPPHGAEQRLHPLRRLPSLGQVPPPRRAPEGQGRLPHLPGTRGRLRRTRRDPVLAARASAHRP